MEPKSLIAPDGTLNPERASEVDLKDQELIDLYRLMVLVRRADSEATALQRQGELAVYPPLLGQEAAQVGSAYALEKQDYVFPSYRELGAALVRGIDLVDYLHFYRATWHGGHYDTVGDRFGMIAVPIASQLPHAVGYALGAKLNSEKTVTLAYFGDGATSQGDFHEACNFSAVFKVGVVFFCQNNHWAISVPVAKQTAAPIADKARGYGMEGFRIDGNDVLECYLTTRKAVDRARAGEGPTLIEAVTYRMGPHSTADDAGRYQPKDEVESWKARDPISRYKKFLTDRGVLTDKDESAIGEAADELAAHIRKGIVGAPPADNSDLFKWVFAEKSPNLTAQEKELLEEAASDD